jgi:hypothetical protein
MINPSYNLLDLVNEDDYDAEDEAPSILQHSPYHNDEDLQKVFDTNPDSFKILSLNCQSLNAKFSELKIYTEGSCSCNFHAICLQETWLSDDSDLSLLQLNGYKFISKGKSSSQHGGVGIYLKDYLKFTVITIDSRAKIWDGLFIEVDINEYVSSGSKKSVIIGNIYRPPRDNLENYNTFLAEIEQILHNFQRTNKDVILVGDFNIDLLKIKERSIYNDYFETILSNGFFPKITYPTRITSSSSTLIDNIFIKLSEHFSYTTSGILLVNISDHLPCFISLDYLQIKKNSKRYVEIRPRSEQDYLNFKTEIAENCALDKFDSSSTCDPNANYEILDNILKNAYEKHLPTKLVKFNKHKHRLSKWITNGILSSIKFRDKLYQRMVASRSDPALFQTLKTNLASYNRILKTLIKNAKKSYYETCFKKYKDDIKKTWNTIKLIFNKTNDKQTFPEAFIVDGISISDVNTIADQFNKYFINIGPNLSENISIPRNSSYQDFLVSPVMNNIFTFRKINHAEVSKIIDDLKPKSSCGIDCISNKLIKLIKYEILSPLTLIINQCIDSGIFPDKLKVAKIIPVYKKNENNLFENYRPISLLPSLSKVIERVMHNQVVNYFTEMKLFYDNQYGFRKSHSTELSALELINRILKSMDKNEVPQAVFIDLSKAFDTINHQILLNKLQYYGIKDKALNLFESYLSNRKQYLSLGSTNSSFMTITTGVPQGSILGPLLFIIYVNDLHLSSKLFHPVIYADDSTLSASLNTFDTPGQERDRNINIELGKISLWFKLNKLSVNSSKTKAMLFHTTRKNVIYPNLVIDGTNVEFVGEFNYLGIILDKHLSWKAHISRISLKLSKVIGIMCRMKNMLPREILLTLYNSLVLPYLNYGILCWRSKINALVKIQKKVVRIVVNERYNAHTEPIFKMLSLLKLQDIAALQELKFCYKYENNRLPSYFMNDLFKRNSDIHSRTTRSCNNLYVPRVRHEFARNSVQYFIPVRYNNCPQSVKAKMLSHSLQGFSKFVKIQFINDYNQVCNNRNCFVCQS